MVGSLIFGSFMTTKREREEKVEKQRGERRDRGRNRQKLQEGSTSRVTTGRRDGERGGEAGA